MKNLQDEVKLDVLQCLNFNQLFSVRQTYYYFNWLIGKYEGILACKEFWQLNLGSKVSGTKIDFALLDGYLCRRFNNFPSCERKEKWQNALDRNIPLYIGGKPGSTYSVQLLPTDGLEPCLILNLPNIPKNIKEMLLIRFCFEQLFNIFIEDASLCEVTFNPELIKLLFEDEKNISLQFRTRISCLHFILNDNKKIMDIALDHLFITKCLFIYFDSYKKIELFPDILILLNKGDKFPIIVFEGLNLELYNMIINHIETSTNCSNLVHNILINFIIPWKINLSNREVEIIDEVAKVEKDEFEAGYNFVRYQTVKYQLFNINNPNFKFNVYNKKKENETIKVVINRII
ncbi:hypothetical protein ACQ4LE_005455 [Meloidogyne hapla]